MSNAHIRKNTLVAVCGLLLLATSGPGAAEFLKKGPSVFNYNFLEAKYIDADGFDGLGLTGSGDIKQNIAVRVDFTQLSSGRFDSSALRLGGTYYIQSQAYPQADWVFGAGLDRYSFDGGGDDSGLFLSAGTRYAINDAMEANATVELTTAGDTDITIRLAGLYEVSTGFSATLGTDIGDDTGISLGVRFYWR